MKNTVDENAITGFRAAISNMLIRYRTIIHLKDGSYELQQIIFGLLRLSSRYPLPPIDYVLLTTSYYAPACENCVVNDEDKAYYQVSLVYNRNRRIITHQTKNLADARNLSTRLMDQLKVAFKDVSGPGKAIWSGVKLRTIE